MRLQNFRCVSDINCIGDTVDIGSDDAGKTEDICLTTTFDIDRLVEHLNTSLGEGTAEKSRYYDKLISCMPEIKYHLI